MDNELQLNVYLKWRDAGLVMIEIASGQRFPTPTAFRSFKAPMTQKTFANGQFLGSGRVNIGEDHIIRRCGEAELESLGIEKLAALRSDFVSWQ